MPARQRRNCGDGFENLMSDHDEIVIALRRIAQASELQSKQLFRASGLTVPQLLVMQAIARDGAPSTSSIARQVCVSQATVTRIIDRLERAGLVCRCKSSVDRRVVNVRLTDSGRDKIVRAPAPLQPGFVARFAALADWEQQMLKAALVRISRMMEGDGIDIVPFAAGDFVRSLFPGNRVNPERPVAERRRRHRAMPHRQYGRQRRTVSIRGRRH